MPAHIARMLLELTDIAPMPDCCRSVHPVYRTPDARLPPGAQSAAILLQISHRWRSMLCPRRHHLRCSRCDQSSGPSPLVIAHRRSLQCLRGSTVRYPRIVGPWPACHMRIDIQFGQLGYLGQE